MKKLFFIFGVFAMSAGVLFAQGNDALIDQTGDDHSATIEQVGSLNESFVVQTDGSDTNNPTVAVADIYQEGTENHVNLNQRAFYGFVNSTAIIDQIGNNNTVRGMNEGEAWYQNQTGGSLDVYMEGDNNTLRSLRGEAQKNRNFLTLDILGSSNDVAAAQEGGKANVDITGSDNNVSLWQVGSGVDSSNELTYNRADVLIEGSFNMVDVNQINHSNNADVNILGSSNTATVTQSGF